MYTNCVAEQNISNEVGQDTGVSGFFASGDLVSGLETNIDLIGTRKFKVFSEMRTQDAQIGGLLQLIRSAVLGADRKIVGGSDEQRDWVTPIIMDELDSHLSKAVLYLLYGQYAFEQIVGRDSSGRFFEERLESRQPWTISDYRKNESGAVIGFSQENYGGLGYVPLDRAVMYINDSEGDNFEGVSVFRPCYGPYLAKRKHMRLELLSAQKVAIGNIHVQMMNADKKKRDAAFTLGKAYRSSGDGVMVTTPNDGIKKMEFLESKGGVYDATAKFQYYDQSMSKALLAQFIDFGSKDKSGSFALVSEHIELFYDMIGRFATHIESVINNQRIKRMIDWNWNDTVDYPNIKFTNFNKADPEILAKTLNLVGDKVTLTDDEEKFLKKAIGFPATEKESKSSESVSTLSVCGCGEVHKLATLPGREFTELEKTVNFEQIVGSLDSETEKLDLIIKKMHQKLVQRYINFLQPIIDRGDSQAVNDLDPRLMVRQFRDLLVKKSEELFAEGQETVIDEAHKSGSTVEMTTIGKSSWLQTLPEDDQIAQSVIGSAEDQAEKIVAATATSAKEGARKAIASGLVGAAAADTVIDSVGRSTNRFISQMAGGIVNQAMINGRDSQAKAMIERGEIGDVFYSAVMDEDTCAVCVGDDGSQVINGQPPAPNVNCLGGSLCRCIHVYEFNV